MPYVRKKGGYKGRARPGLSKRRKFYRNKNRGVIIKTQLPRMPKGPFGKLNEVAPLPLTMRTKFVYDAQGVMTSGGSGSTLIAEEYKFRLNSVYDPYTGTTGSYNVGTNGYTNLVTNNGPYRRYKVNGVQVEVVIYDPAGTDSDATELCLVVRDPTLGATFTIVGSNAQTIEASQSGIVKRVAGTGSQRRYVRQYFPMAQLFNWSKEQFSADKGNTTGPYNNDPASSPILFVGICNRRGPATATTAIVRVRLTFYTELYERYLVPPV